MPCDDEIEALQEAVEAYQRAQSEFSVAMHNLAAALASLGSGGVSGIDCLFELFDPEESPDFHDMLGCVQALFDIVSGEEWVRSAAESVELEGADLEAARDDLAEANAEFIHCIAAIAAPPSPP